MSYFHELFFYVLLPRFFQLSSFEIICVVWDIYSTYVSKSFVQFILDHFVPNFDINSSFSPSVINYLIFEISDSFTML